VFDKYVLGYDANRNITKVTSTAGVTTYTYDDLNQLISETLPNGKLIEYSYDDVGNRLSKVEKVNGIITDSNNYGFNAGNQLVNVNGQAYTYDDNGNLNSDGVNTYQFNDFNQLESIKNSAGQVIATYTYDESGKRISSTTPAGTIKYFYDGNQVLYETDGNNNKLREYTYTSSGLPATITIGGNTYYYLTNHHGDVVAITNASGGVVATYSYDAWGNILSQSGSLASVNPYRYAGYRYDENSKLYYLMARYYNSDIGGFLSKDPVTGDLHDPSSLNGYNYAYNNPVMIFDPTGEVGILISMGTNAFINLLCYIIPLLVDHGQNFYKHINYRTMGIEIMKGAISGIIGFNIGKIKTLRMLAKPLRRVFDAHLAPLTYFLMNFRSGYSGEGLYEEILFALIGNKGTVIYTTYKSIVKKAKKKSLFSIFS
jgi:RHS repeat-associated protein